MQYQSSNICQIFIVPYKNIMQMFIVIIYFHICPNIVCFSSVKKSALVLISDLPGWSTTIFVYTDRFQPWSCRQIYYHSENKNAVRFPLWSNDLGAQANQLGGLWKILVNIKNGLKICIDAIILMWRDVNHIISDFQS